jgi:hypothetical protein
MQALVSAVFVTGMVGIGILGARWIIMDALYKEYCVCDHEFNQHFVAPRGIQLPEGWPDTEQCKVCMCRSYRKKP